MPLEEGGQSAEDLNAAAIRQIISGAITGEDVIDIFEQAGGEALGLTQDELAFYDALANHGGVREVMGDEVLAAIAHDLIDAIKASVTIDWAPKGSVRAKMRTTIRQLLRKHGYPPDIRESAVPSPIS